MSNEIIEMYGVPDVFGDGIAEVQVISNVVRFCFWQWEKSAGGILHRVCSAKVRVTRDGMVASRQLVTDALAGLDSLTAKQSDGATAH